MTNEQTPSRNPVPETTLTSITQLEERAAVVFKQYFDIELNKDEAAIKDLSNFINEYRNKFDKEAENAWYQLIGAFLGQTIISVYGGRWIEIESSSACIELNDGSICFPFDKVAKQMENGQEDSIHYYFNFITEILNKELPFQ